jgi:hypothetical protein
MTMMMTELAARNLTAFFALLAVVQLIAKEVGYALGRYQMRNPTFKDDSVGMVSASIFGLLAFSLAFNLSLAAGRYNDRLSAALDEANSIGTLWLQAKAVDHPRAVAIADLTEQYIALRKQGITADWGDEEIKNAANEISRMQNEMWGHLTALIKDRVDPQIAQLTGSMNATFDSTTTMQNLAHRTTPPEVIWLLLWMTMVAMGVMGFQFALNGHPHRLLGLTTILVWTSVLLVILDLGAARIGDIRIDTTSYDSTISSMKPIPIPVLTP